MDSLNKLKEKRKQIAHSLMENGVNIIDWENTYIDEEVQIERGVTIGPCVVIRGGTFIGENTVIDQNSRIENSFIGKNVHIMSSYVLDSKVGDHSKIGPFAYIRPGSVIGEDCKIGDFVEVKNSNIGNGTKASHLTYIGDADLGENINLGCGVVFVNYDGSKKYRSKIEDNAFIGCNSNIISPVKVGEGAYIAAGSTVTEDIEPDALYIARSKGIQKKHWVKKRGIWKNNTK